MNIFRDIVTVSELNVQVHLAPSANNLADQLTRVPARWLRIDKVAAGAAAAAVADVGMTSVVTICVVTTREAAAGMVIADAVTTSRQLSMMYRQSMLGAILVWTELLVWRERGLVWKSLEKWSRRSCPAVIGAHASIW